MAGEAISSLILFIAAMLVAVGVAGTLVAGVGDLSGSLDSVSGSVSDDIDTEVEIISDPGSDAVVGDNNETVTVLVKNTGARTLPTDGSELEFLVDGSYVANGNISVTVYESNTWRTGSVAAVELALDGPIGTGEHRVHLTAGGSEELFEFYYGGP
ncbi:flagellar protein G [Halovivax limisalsi]|uniref:flagellar protein G n=1 Tax=Halovivax limisalsi TaxID=1453760 RepID=UPI001FFC7AC0|nr:flagellar protein G [Halovivax limisalsi]